MIWVCAETECLLERTVQSLRYVEKAGILQPSGHPLPRPVMRSLETRTRKALGRKIDFSVRNKTHTLRTPEKETKTKQNTQKYPLAALGSS
jgi:hypothetical protein